MIFPEIHIEIQLIMKYFEKYFGLIAGFASIISVVIFAFTNKTNAIIALE
jgi:hypothetical protein